MYDTRYWRSRYKGVHGGFASAAYNDEYGNAPGRGVVVERANEYSQKENFCTP